MKHSILPTLLAIGVFVTGLPILESRASGLDEYEAIFGIVDEQVLVRVQELLDVPEDQVDFTGAKLTIDHLIDPNTNIFRETMRIERMVDDINAMGPFLTSMHKIDALRKFLYVPSKWNQFRSLSYDLSDPRGTNVQNKLLQNYLDTGKGNCVSMPLLFIALGQKLGLDVAVSTAPLHVFVKFTEDETGHTYNLETTSGANPARDAWIRQNFPMTDAAVENGIYLQKLSKQETVAVMVNTLQQHYMEKKQFGMVILLTEMILDVYPRSVSALLYTANAFNELLKVHDLWQYPVTTDVPAKKRPLFNYLVSSSNGYHDQAVRMGWHQPTQLEEEGYRNRFEQAVLN